MNKIEILDEQGPSGEVIVKIGPLSSEELIFGLNKPMALDVATNTNTCSHIFENGLSAFVPASPTIGERIECLIICQLCGKMFF